MNETIVLDEPLHRTVAILCEILQSDISLRHPVVSEEKLRFELVACLLSSQVRASTADAAMGRLYEVGLLSNARWRKRDKEFEADVAICLANRGSEQQKGGAYRFPNLRARQITQMRTLLQSKSLALRLATCVHAMELRAELVREFPGIGPKQASMFLRNVGRSYDLAILDVHVLEFLYRLGLADPENTSVSKLVQYEQAEAHMKRYAVKCGHPVGYLDWAIWITMQAAKELGT